MDVFQTQRPIGFSSVEISQQVNEEVVAQHVEDTAFLWLLRDAAVKAPHYKLQDLADLDERLDANIEGLRVASEFGWQLCLEALEYDEPGEVFAASVLAFESEHGGRVERVVTSGFESYENFRALVSALGWIDKRQLKRWLPGLLSARSIHYRQLGLAACSINRIDPGEALNLALKDNEPTLQRHALRAIGRLKRADLRHELSRHFQNEDPSCRFWAAWSAALMGSNQAVEILKTFVVLDKSYRRQAMNVMFRVMQPEDINEWLSGLGAYPDAARDVVEGAAIAGDPVVIPWLIQRMQYPELARAAGEAVSLITGVDIAYEDLDAEQPEGFEVGPFEDEEDERVEMDEDEDLPWPDPELMDVWWNKHKKQFHSGIRYLAGQPISLKHCRYVLANGFQRQRIAASMELAFLESDKVLFETRAPGKQQQKVISTWTS